MLDRNGKENQELKSTPHMLRHYFANMRKQAGWELEMISQALGHKAFGYDYKVSGLAG